jgi:short subunit dehydrogenase-like uncharacterized protein
MHRRVVVFGATGFTGSLVAAELGRLGIPALLTGRNRQRADALADRVGAAGAAAIDVTDPESVRTVLRRDDVAINCAGPFSELGEPVVAACVRSGAHYLDTTGEQRFIRRIADHYHAAASDAGVVVVNAMAFEYALGCFAAELAASELDRPLRSIDMTYAWPGAAAAASRGTRHSVLRVVRDGGFAYREGEWVAAGAGSRARDVEVGGGRRRAIWFPAGEIVMLPRTLEVSRVDAWMVVTPALTRLLPWVAPVLPALASLVSPIHGRLIDRGPDGPSDAQRSASRYLVAAEVIGADGAVASVAMRGTDPYGITAALAAAGAATLLAKESPARPGIRSPAQVLHPRAIHALLAQWGVSLQRTGAAPD